MVLKRLEDAQADGDAIHGLIRGFAINNDGDLKVGYTAPSVEGQAEVIREALEMAGASAATIGYVETHGTGTDLGDPVEITALTEAFRTSTDEAGFCAIGSVKSNIGHLDTAAGTASLIKTLLALKHGQIPPTLHFQRPNPEIDFADTPFYVNAQLANWQRPAELPRRAGVSSFGIGGTNAHIIVEEAPEAIGGPSRDWQLLPLSARSPSALDEMTGDLANHIQNHPEQDLADIARTLQVGRGEFDYRQIAVVRDRDEAIQSVRERSTGRVYAGQSNSSPPVMFLFPGQDVQHINMAAQLRRQESVFRDALQECADILSPHGIDLDELIWPSSANGQPRFDADFAVDPVPLFAVEYALVRLWRSWGVEPSAMLGYSLGEYVAATIAGVIGLDDALALAV
ncbi:MAG: type I polyketide synthase, partial [Candidatus Latescibacterota bacterium]|nr:type I polyketide synthase [Candidatus Latescibacterota bacterium]